MSRIERPREKRYGWFRMYNGFWDHAKWKVATRISGFHITHVQGVAGKLLEAANKGRPRGSIADFSVLECAGSLDLDPSEVARIYDVLEGLAWIDRDYIVTWDDRQPDKEDPTTRERTARYRERKKAERGKFPEQNQCASHRDKRDGHAIDQTHTSKKEETVTALRPGDQTSSYANAEAWLKEHRTKQREMPFFSAMKQRGDR